MWSPKADAPETSSNPPLTRGRRSVIARSAVFLALFLAGVLALGFGRLEIAGHRLAKGVCLLWAHDWRHEVSDTWVWRYNPKGTHFPHGYKYRVMPNTIACSRCGSVLFDKSYVEDSVTPLGVSETVPAAARPDAGAPWISPRPEGVIRTAHPNGNPAHVWSYRHGRLDGPSADYYPDGQLRNRWSARSDELEGIAEGFSKDGTIRWRDRFREGRNEGLSEEFHENGSLKHVYRYERGVLQGPSEIRYANGALKRSESYRDGQIDGLRRDYYEGGSLKREQRYEGGVLHGETREYHPDGWLRYKRVYERGTETLRVSYGPDGRPVAESRPGVQGYREIPEGADAASL